MAVEARRSLQRITGIYLSLALQAVRTTSRIPGPSFVPLNTGRTLINRDKYSRGLAGWSQAVDHGAW